jgi:hypothetical protein
MYLQTARYLVKNVLTVQAGKPLTGSAAYLADAAQQVRRRAAACIESVPDLAAKEAHARLTTSLL